MGEVLSVRIDNDLKKRLTFLMKQKKIVDKSAYIRQLINRSLTEDLLDYLAEKVTAKHITIWKASLIAGISLRAVMAEFSKRNVSMYDDQSLLEDLLFAEGELK